MASSSARAERLPAGAAILADGAAAGASAPVGALVAPTLRARAASPADTLPRDAHGRVELLGLDRAGLVRLSETLGEKPYRARQLMKWLHGHRVRDPAAMSDLPARLRARLAERASVALPTIRLERRSGDGTAKWLLELADGNRIETVYIPDAAERGTLCVSSQVGCALDCSFCATGRQGFARNLSTAEIVGQLWLAAARLAEEPGASCGRVTNVVMMGMGEPLANYARLVPALRVMLDDLGWGLSKRRVTVSTAGLVPAMDRLTREIDVALAVSLHAPNDRLRDELVPINRKYPIAELMAACRRYVEAPETGAEAPRRRKHVLFEYVLLDGVNDSSREARELADLLHGFPAKVNLIPFNPFSASGYRRSPTVAIERFAAALQRAGIVTLVRATRGEDIDAACGQLAGDIVDRSDRARRFAEPRFGEIFR